MFFKKQILGGFAVLFCMTAAFSQPVTRQIAVSMVKSQIIGSDTLNFNIYMYPSVYTSGFCKTRNNDTIYNPYAYARLFFIDEMPGYNWGHNCQYIFIDTISGNYQEFNNNFFPFDFKNNMDSISIVYYEIDSIPIIPPQTPTVYANQFDPNKYALIFSGDERNMRWNDLSHMYSALKLNGYLDENIFVFIPEEAENWDLDIDKDEINDVDGYCTYNNIESILYYLSNSMTEKDIFFFYCSTHGGSEDTVTGDSYLVLQENQDELNDYELQEMVQGFSCAEIIFVIDACFSGGFVPELMGDHRTVQTCTNKNMVMTTVPILGYNFLAYAYATALKGYHPVIGQPWSTNFEAPIGVQELVLIYPPWIDKEDINPDEIVQNGNGDGFYQTGEAFSYAQYLCGQIKDEGQNYQNHGFKEDILSIYGIVGKVTTTQTVSGSFIVGGPLSIEPDVDLTLDDDGRFYLQNVELLISPTASLTLGENTLINGAPDGELTVDGALITNYNQVFYAPENGTLKIQLSSEAFEIEAGTFNNCIIDSHADPLEMSDCVFENSFIEHFMQDLNISGSSFTNSSISAINFSTILPPIENTFSVSGCDFHTAFEDANAILELYGYRNFYITSNSIDNEGNPDDVANSISIHFSGGVENYNTHDIIENEIFCTSGNCDNDLAGITLYSSQADIRNNNIHNNQIGIQSLNFNNLNIIGNENANFEHQTQRIKHNEICQIFASENAFPISTAWNAIYSADSYDCFIRHDVDMQNLPPEVDVSYNYWGPVFEAERNLCPPDHFEYMPIWELQYEEDLLSSAQQLYELSLSQIEEGNYTEAKLTLQDVVRHYSDEEPAKNSLKALLTLEPLADNDFNSLKSYYLTDSVILSNENLMQLADNLSNKCDENLGNYTEAISWYENTIENPETLEDSVFAIIDLEHLYLLIENDTSQRSSGYLGKFSQFKPASIKAHKDHRDELIALLHSWHNNQPNQDDQLIIIGAEENSYFFIAPNPFHYTSMFHYNLTHESNIQIKIYNNLGQLIESIIESGKPKGNYSYRYHASNLNKGIYFCTLIVNGQVAKSIKMLLN